METLESQCFYKKNELMHWRICTVFSVTYLNEKLSGKCFTSRQKAFRWQSKNYFASQTQKNKFVQVAKIRFIEQVECCMMFSHLDVKKKLRVIWNITQGHEKQSCCIAISLKSQNISRPGSLNNFQNYWKRLFVDCKNQRGIRQTNTKGAL